MTGTIMSAFQNALERVGRRKAATVERAARSLAVRVSRADADGSLIYGVASAADIVDADGELIPPEALEQAAHRFAERAWHGQARVKVNHKEEADAVVVQSSIGITHGVHAWNIAVQLNDPELRQMARANSIKGFSIAGTAVARKQENGPTLLLDWDVEEISLVTGEFSPVNPAAVAVTIKAKEQGMKPLGEIKELLEKAVRVITRESTYESTGTNKDVMTEEVKEPVVTDPAFSADPAAKAAPDVDALVARALEPVVKAVVTIADEVGKLKAAPAPSQQVPREPARVEPVRKSKFPHFRKAVYDRAVAQGLMRPGEQMSIETAKATIATSGWSYGLHTEEATAFIDTVVDQSALIKQIRRVVMTGKKQNVNAIGLGSTVFKKGTIGTDPGDTVSLSGPTQVQLSAEEIVAIVSIGDDTTEFSIEADAFIEHVLGMIARAGANEIEAAIIHGDTAVSDTGILDRWDGVLKQAIAAGHVIEGMTATTRYWAGANGIKGSQLIRALPTKFRQDVTALRFFVHPDAYQNYEDDMGGLASSEAYRAIVGAGQKLTLRNVPQVTVPLMKTDIAFTHSSTNYTDGTVVLLTDPRNIIFGVNRDIRVEPMRQPRKRATDFVVSLQGDCKIETADATAVYNHLAVRAA